MKAYQKVWGKYDADGKRIPTYFKEIETEPCKESDINFNGDSNEEAYRFYKPTESESSAVKDYYKDFRCMKEDAVVQGDFNSWTGQQLVIRFEMCVDAPETPVEQRKCKTEEQILEWIQRTFIVTLEN